MGTPPTALDIVGPGPYELAESAVAHNGVLYFVDLLAGRVWQRRHGPGGPSVPAARLPEPVGAVLATEAGTLRVAHGLAVSRLRDGVVSDTVRLPGDPGTHRVNDAIIDSWGRVWVGVMPYQSEERTGAVYCVADTEVTLIRQNLGIPNGFGLSPDGHRLLHVETLAREVTVFDITPERSEATAVGAFTVPGPGLPDGLTVGRDGHLWIAMWGGSCVVRLTATGRRVDTVPLPCRQPTSCALVGDDLYVTSARLGLGPDAGPADGAVLRLSLGACDPAD